MPYTAVRCPTCAGEIQLDDSREYGFCLYCGGKVIYKEAVQRLQLSGSVAVHSNIEPMLKSADGFQVLGHLKEARKLYEEVVHLDSTDYRGWWGLFQIDSRIGDSIYYAYNRQVALNNAGNAIKLAPPGKKAELADVLNKFKVECEAYDEGVRKQRVQEAKNQEIAAAENQKKREADELLARQREAEHAKRVRRAALREKIPKIIAAVMMVSSPFVFFSGIGGVLTGVFLGFGLFFGGVGVLYFFT